jgi:RNA-directed DNA polymerase
MQRKLTTRTSTDKTRRVNRLLRLISHPAWLQHAAKITLSSSGANTAGIDGITKVHLQDNLDSYLTDIRLRLLSGEYQPMPARRVYIPKANDKQRPLGIPSLKDRIVQRAMLMAMEPIWENDFHSLSYGFRPERSVHHAIRTVQLQLNGPDIPRGRWVIEGDLSSYFDTVHHKLLMTCVRKRIGCERFNSLLWRFMKAGHIEQLILCNKSGGASRRCYLAIVVKYHVK